MSVWMLLTFLQIATSPILCPILTKLGTHDVCANMQKIVERIF